MKTPDFFKVKKMEIFRYLLMDFDKSWVLWTITSLGLILIILGVFISIRFLVAGMIICMTVSPMIAFFTYYSHMLDTHLLANVLPHTIERCAGGYRVHIYQKVIRKDEVGTEYEDWVEISRITVLDSNIKKMVEKRDFTVLYVVESPVNVLYVPSNLPIEPVACEIKLRHKDENS